MAGNIFKKFPSGKEDVDDPPSDFWLFRLYSMVEKDTSACKQITVYVNGNRKVKCPSLVFEAMPSLPK